MFVYADLPDLAVGLILLALSLLALCTLPDSDRQAAELHVEGSGGGCHQKGA